MKKMGIAILSMCLCAIASYLIVYSVSPNSDDMVYDIDSDVDLLYISPGPSVPQYRYNATTGTWQRQSTIGAPWYDASTTTLTQMLNDLGVATVADIATSSDFLTALDGYFGSDSFTDNANFQIQRDAMAGPYTTDVASLLDWLNDYALYSSYNQMFYPNWLYLNYHGSLSSETVYRSFPFVIANGFAGLAYLLGGGVNSNGHSYFVDVIANQDQLYNSLFDSSFVSSGIYAPMEVGDSSVTSSDFVSYLGAYLKNIQRPLVTRNGFLWNDGSELTNYSGYNYSLSDVTGKGFLGLAAILRGSPDENGDVSPHTFTVTDYSTLDTSEVEISDILTALLLPMQSIQGNLAEYMYSHGTDLDIKERENMEEQAEQFVDDFTGPDGRGTPTTGQISDTAGVSGGIKDAFTGSSSPADAFTQITDSDNYSFLSSQTQSELNPFYSSRSRSSDIIDFVGPKLNEIQSGVGSSW